MDADKDLSNAGTLEIWHGNISTCDAQYKTYWNNLSSIEQAHAGKITNDLLRFRYVEVHGRLRNILGKILNEQPNRLIIKITEHGKPYLADNPELAFNLSHSADTMLIAIGYNCQLGIDIENCKARVNLTALVDKCFSEEEITYWNTLPESEKTAGFYRFWTRKEAFVKATGRGIALGLNQCVIDPENQSTFLRVPADYDPASKWHVRDLALNPKVCSALVSDKAINDIKLVDLEASI